MLPAVAQRVPRSSDDGGGGGDGALQALTGNTDAPVAAALSDMTLPQKGINVDYSSVVIYGALLVSSYFCTPLFHYILLIIVNCHYLFYYTVLGHFICVFSLVYVILYDARFDYCLLFQSSRLFLLWRRDLHFMKSNHN